MLTQRTDTRPLVVAKLADFGFAKAEMSALTTTCGTPEYVAPEILVAGAAPAKTQYGHQCDVWSMGVVLYVMLTAAQPFGQTVRLDSRDQGCHSSPFDDCNTCI